MCICSCIFDIANFLFLSVLLSFFNFTVCFNLFFMIILNQRKIYHPFRCVSMYQCISSRYLRDFKIHNLYIWIVFCK